MVLDKARDLGIALSESEEFVRMNNARAALDANEAVSGMLEEYQQKQARIVEMLSADDVDHSEVVVLSSDVEVLQEQLLENPLFSQAMETQNAFQNLMRMVNQEIARCIGAEMADDHADGCAGSCSSCSGCHH